MTITGAHGWEHADTIVYNLANTEGVQAHSYGVDTRPTTVLKHSPLHGEAVMMEAKSKFPGHEMRLPFRYQFLLAPAVVIALLTGLVAYILFELPHISRENEMTKQWELVTGFKS